MPQVIVVSKPYSVTDRKGNSKRIVVKEVRDGRVISTSGEIYSMKTNTFKKERE